MKNIIAITSIALSFVFSGEIAFADKIKNKQIQTYLNEMGYSVGEIDGVIGRNTKSKISSLFDDFGLRFNGDVNERVYEIIEKIYLGDPIPLDQKTGSVLAFTNGPFVGISRQIITTDVSKFGCNGCQPTTRVLALADLDKDGFDEILVANETVWNADLTKLVDFKFPLKIFNHDGSEYKGLISQISRISTREAVTADFNGDGIIDIFIIAIGIDHAPSDGEQNVLILSNNEGNHVDVSSTHLPQMIDFAHGVGASDIDNDGDIDLFVTVNGVGGKARVDNYFLINDGKGKMTFSPSKNHLASNKLRKSNSNFATARFGDVDGDGLADLIMAGYGKSKTGTIVVYGNGDGTFTKQRQLPSPRHAKYTNTYDIDITDLNGDGLKDILLTMSGGNDIWGMALQVLIQDEKGNFDDQSEMRLWEQTSTDDKDIWFPENLTLADLDLDGDLDIVVQSWNPIWRDNEWDVAPQIGLNDGSGFFQPVIRSWFANNGWGWRGMLPIKLKDRYGIIGLDLNRKFYQGEEITVGSKISIYSK